MSKEWIDKCKALLNKSTRYRMLCVIGLIGVVLIGASSFFEKEEMSLADTEDVSTQYITALEQRLEDMVSAVTGAGKTKVMVTLENGVEYVYANEEKTNSDHTTHDSGSVSDSDDSQRTIVTVDSGDGKQGLLVTEIQPTVRGVVVACEGADNERVCELVTAAVKTALNITDKRVCVIPYTAKGETNP